MESEVKVSGNRLRITRMFNAPREIVFEWWTQAEKLQRWSGCKDATKCEIKMDFRVGGSFTQKMQITVPVNFRLQANTLRSSGRKRSRMTWISARPSPEWLSNSTLKAIAQKRS